MSQLLEMIGQQLNPAQVSQIAQSLGASEGATAAAIEASLPMLISGLAKNASNPNGASALASALDRDHDGTILDQVGPLLGGLLGGGNQSGDAPRIGDGHLIKAALGGLFGGNKSEGDGPRLGDGHIIKAALGGASGGSLLGMFASALTSAPGPGSNKTADGAGILGHILGGRRGAVQNGVSQASGLGGAQTGQLMELLAPMLMGGLGRMKQQNGLDAGGLAQQLGQEQQSIQQRAGGGLLGAFLDKDGDGDIADDVASMGAQMVGKQLLGQLLG